MKTTPVISLCMIVKDEEAFLEKCLSSVRGFADEIIIIDTGSTDNTVHIAKRFQANVYHHKWKHHFAAARNKGIAEAAGEWILWLDADERINIQDAAMWKENIKKREANLLFLPITNLTGESLNISDQASYIHYQPRLFRNHQGIHFVNRIHETLDAKDTEKLTTDVLELPILHYGYIEEVTAVKQKSERNITLLKKETEIQSHSPWIAYHLASEYYRLKEYSEALESLNQSIFDFLLIGQKPPSILYKLKYDILIRTNSMEQALPGIEKALLLYPDYVDLHFYKGLILFHQMDYEGAIACFNKCIELGENHPQYVVLKGVGSFRAAHYKKICTEKLKTSGEGEKS